MSSPKSRNEPFFIGKQCYECINCGTLVEFEWHEDDSCSCEEEEKILGRKKDGSDSSNDDHLGTRNTAGEGN